MFKKMTFFTIMSAVSSLLMVSMMKEETVLELSLMNSSSMALSMSMSMDKVSMMFLFMVSTVTSMVLSYSEMYMEAYNKKKFFFVMMSFFSSMIILSVSNSTMTTITGWDGLGITSIALIMMYQNFDTMSKSLLTMFFNRTGDFFLFLALIDYLKMMNEEVSQNSNYSSAWMSTMIIMTSMTKSAQIPLAAWLPAAMAAPTPISAMVHSSTLVTAGAYLIMKMNTMLMKVLPAMILVTSVTLATASVSANVEKDLKKIIAFSTMSQISIIMLMSACNMKMMAMTHMFNHAMFKTLTFMSAGKIFLENFSNQDKRSIKESSSKNNKLNKSCLMAGILAMSGLPFSSSFFSKDLFMETLKWQNKFQSTFILMMMAGVATILYCKKIIYSAKESMKASKSIKKMDSLSFLTASALSISSGSCMSWMMEIINKPINQKMEITLITTTMIAACFLKTYNSILSKNLAIPMMEMMFSKWMMSSFMMKLSKVSKDISNSEFIMTTNKSWVPYKGMFQMKYKNSNPIKQSAIWVLIMIWMFL